jgi:RHS repeat-associated protein
MKRNAIRFVVALLAVMFFGIAHAGTHHYYYTDPQGTVLAKADASGTIIATYDYAPYGAAVASMSPAPNGPGYTGHVNDPESGLVYMQARYYDPSVGRFLSVDPVTPAAGNAFNFNRYAYVSNNPVVNIDPDGKQCYGYGTTIPTCATNGGNFTDCHQTNSCRTQAEADAIVRNDAKTIVLIQAGTATAAAGGAALTSSELAVGPAIGAAAKKNIIRMACAYLSLCPNAPHPPDPKYNPMDPPGETQMGDQMEKLAELWRRALESLRNRETTPTEPTPAPPPPPTPPPPSPTTQ